MKLKRVLKKEFYITLFIKQNKWHRYGVLLHTFAVAFHILKAKEYKMLAAAFLHDIGKPYVAYQNEKDKITGWIISLYVSTCFTIMFPLLQTSFKRIKL